MVNRLVRRRFLAWLGRAAALLPAPEFVILCGDMIHGEDLPSLGPDLGLFKDLIAGTASYPCDFASFEVYPDRIRMQLHGLPPHLLTPETNIHGVRRHGTDFTDTLHATAEAYVMGNPDERTVDMPLPRRI